MGIADRESGNLQQGRFNALLRAATDYAIIGVDSAGTITVFNSGAERMLGYRADELVGRATPVVFHDAAEIEARAAELGIEPGFDVFVQAARAGESETREWTYVRRDGATLPVSLTVTVIDADGSSPAGFLGIARDLTADREARAELVRAAQRFAAAFEANPIPTIISRVADGRILMANSASLSMLGWPAEEFIGRTAADIDFWAYPEQRQGIFERLRAEGRAREVAVDIRRRDGAIRQALGTVELLEVNGERCLIAIFQDVTENMRLQAALRESEARLVAFLDHAPALVSLKDSEGRFRLVNRRFTEAFGLSPEDVIGRTTREIFPHAADAAEAADEQVLTEGVGASLEQSIPGIDGVVRDYQVLKFPLRRADGQVDAVGTIATEVTERQQAALWAAQLFDAFEAPVGLYQPVRDAGGEVVDFVRNYANPRLGVILGRPMSEVIGATLRRTSLEATMDMVFQAFSRVLESGEPELLPDIGLTDPATGQQIVLAVRVTRIGEHVVSVAQDVTQERAAEAAINLARTEAESASRAKSEFARAARPGPRSTRRTARPDRRSPSGVPGMRAPSPR